jgi:hypothetical protein
LVFWVIEPKDKTPSLSHPIKRYLKLILAAIKNYPAGLKKENLTSNTFQSCPSPSHILPYEI